MSILNLEISNTGPESYRTATALSFPATDERIQEVLNKAQITDSHSGYKNEIVYCQYAWLRPHIMRDADINEVNLLAQRLQNHIPNELDILESMIKIEMERNGSQPVPLSRLINMTYSTQHVIIASNISDDASLGQFLYENGFFEGADAGALEARIDAGRPVADFYALMGKEHREGMGMITKSHQYMEWDGTLNEGYIPDFATQEQTQADIRAPSVIFARVQLWSDTHQSCDYFTGIIPSGEDDLRKDPDCEEFLQNAVKAGAEEITARVTTFIEGPDEPQPASAEDIDRIYDVIADGDIDVIQGWERRGEEHFTFAPEQEEQPGMSGIE